MESKEKRTLREKNSARREGLSQKTQKTQNTLKKKKNLNSLTYETTLEQEH